MRSLCDRGADVPVAREAEAAAHAAALDEETYFDLIERACFNYREGIPGELLVHSSDRVLSRGTPLEAMEREAKLRRDRFQSMLNEKYEALNDRKYTAIVRCRFCGSSEITWEEKQVRSADEAMSLFCVCMKCRKRFVVR